MKKLIGVVELYQHNEVLIHYCDLLLFGNHQLFVFCNENVFNDLPERLKKSNIKWFLNDSHNNIGKFIKKSEASIKECDFLLVTTIFSHFPAFKELVSWNRTALIIHSAHTWFQPFKYIHLRKGHKLSDCLRLLKLIFLRQSRLRRLILQEVRYIGLPNETILKYVNKHFTSPGNSQFVSIPFGAYEGRGKNRIKEEYTTFTITGSIGDDVRNYVSVLKAINLLLPFLNKKIKLVLLGKPKRKIGQVLKKAFEDISHPFLKIVTFSGYIAQDDYNNYLAETDYLILPLKKYTQFYVFRELTCYSKLSGSVNDMIRYGIPAIASKNCKIDDLVNQSINYYETTEELAERILNLAFAKNVKRTEEELQTTFQKHQKEYLYKKIKEIIEA